MECCRRDAPPRTRHQPQKGGKLAAPPDPFGAVVPPVAHEIERLFPHTVANQHELLLASIPEGKGKHAVKIGDTLLPLLLVEMNDGLHIRVGAQIVPPGLQNAPQLAMIIDLPVARDGNRAVLVVDWLGASSQINDRQAAHGHCHVRRLKKSIRVRAAMEQRLIDVLEQGKITIPKRGAAYDTADTAHPANSPRCLRADWCRIANPQRGLSHPSCV